MRRVSSPLMNAAELHADAPAVITPEQVISYAMAARLVNGLADELRGAGITAGQRVSIRYANSPEYVFMLAALFEIGAIACPVSDRLPPLSLEVHLKSIDCNFLISTPDIDLSGGGIGTLTMPALERIPSGSIKESELDLAREATIMFTSGSGGSAKGVLHTLGNHYFNALGSNENIKLAPGDRWLMSLPLYHVGGMGILFRCVLEGGAMVFADREMSLADAVARFGVTHISCVSTQLRRLLNDNRFADLSGRLKGVLLGGGSIPTRLVSDAHAIGMPLHTSYGLTEMGSQVTTTPPGSAVDALQTSGRLLSYREMRFALDGEIMVSGQTRFEGYCVVGGISKPFDRDGWFHTGDIGRLNSDGNLIVSGRKDNMFISGGENVHPEEIEQAILDIRGVEEAVVVPVDDEEYEFRPVAFVKGQADVVDRETIRGALGETLPRFKIPVRIYGWPEGIERTGIKFSRDRFRQLAQKLR